MNLLDPVLGVKGRKYAAAALLVANVLLVVLQVAADQLTTLPWPWAVGASVVVASVIRYLAVATAFGNKALPPQ